MPAHADEHHAARSARQEALRRVYDLAWRDMYELWTVVGAYLLAGTQVHEGGAGRTSESKAEKRLRQCAEAIDAIAAVAIELKLPDGQAPIIKEYDATAQRLGLKYSSQQIIRRWASWDDAVHAFVTGRVSETPDQLALRRWTAGKKRTHEERLIGVRAWLATSPASLTTKDYDAWVRAANSRLAPNEPPYVKSPAIWSGLALDWKRILAVGRYELELHEAQKEALDEALRLSGPLRLIGLRAIALLLGTSTNVAQQRRERPDFPTPVANIGDIEAWFCDDIEAHIEGRPVPTRVRGELNRQIMNSADAREPQGMQADSFMSLVNRRKWELVPPPAGSVSQNWYWLRDDVQRWYEARPHRLAKTRTAGERQHKS